MDTTNRKRKHPLRSVWNALTYLVKTGCHWRMLPRDFPKWQLVYYHYRKWVEPEVFDKLLDKLRSKVRLSKGHNARATVRIMDSQSVRWGNNRALKSYGGGKKVTGIKRHVVVDKNGFLLAVMVTVAHIHDSQTVVWLMRVLQDSYASIKTVLADGGYRRDIIEIVKNKFGYLLQVVMRPTQQRLPTLSLSDSLVKQIKSKSENLLEQKMKDQGKQVFQTRHNLEKIDTQLHSLEEKFINNQITSDAYSRWHTDLTCKRIEANNTLEKLSCSGQQTRLRLKNEIHRLTDLRCVWQSADTPQKQELIRLLFGNSLYYQNTAYRTSYLIPTFTHNVLILKEKRLLFVDAFDAKAGKILLG